ncbi:MAG: folylpolyglutamate synthase/dihydrofolate synthase family protein [Desulfobacterales bacterium]
MPLKDTYNRCLKTMYGLRRFGIILGLETIKGILNTLGNPQNNFISIHVAGTNGKGSVASALSSILHESGYKVGLYTSPHLVRFNERICINNRQISDADVVKSYKAIQQVHHGDRSPTFFEFATAMALYEFGRQSVDWAVIETGMGGRFDATNVIQPAISIITNVSMEHRDYLGNTLAQITREKAGIIKRGAPVVTAIKQKQALTVVHRVAGKESAPLYILGKNFKVRRHRAGEFCYYGIENTWHNMHTPLLGHYQVENAALAIAACELLNNDKAKISRKNIKNGLTKTRWPGRLEIVSENPFVILDGAHNLIAARNLAKFLSENLVDRRITLVVGILDDKPYGAMLKSLLPVCSRAIITRAKTDRALAPQRLYAVAKKIIPDVTMIPGVAAAVRQAVETASPDEVVCIAGSLYVVGEAKEAIEKGLIKSVKT